MDEWRARYYEILAAVDVCKQKNFSRSSVRDAVALIKAYCDETPIRADAQKLTRVAAMLADKMEERERLDEEWRNRRGDDRYSRLFPVIPPSALPAAPVGNVSVLEANQIYRDNTQLLIGPFESELIFLTKFYAKRVSAAYRLVNLASEEITDAEELFRSLGGAVGNAAAQEVVVYTGVREICASAAKSFCGYLRSNRLNKPNVRQFVLSPSPAFSFNEIYAANIAAGSEEIADSPLPVLYLPLPSFETVKNHILRKFGSFSEETLKREGYLLGYEGLSALLGSEEGEGEGEGVDLDARISNLTSAKREEFEAFAQSASFNLERVLDPDWGLHVEEPPIPVPAGGPVWEPVFNVPATLYDSVDGLDVIRRNVIKIAERKDIPVRVRCGWVVTYAMTNGDLFNLVNLDEGQLESVLKGRWTIAYAALTQLMRVPFGELLFDIEASSSMRGLCCDGGKTIRMNETYVRTQDRKEIGRGCKTLLHELFHALQSEGVKARERQDTDMLGYFLTQFRVSGHRIREWAENDKHYHKSEDDFDVYYDQIKEADARVFADEVMSEFGQMNIPDPDEWD